MRTRKIIQSFVMTALLCCAVPAEAALKRFSYDPYSAAAYARNNVNVPYGSKSGQNPFYSFQNNCANFVSQAIIAGMIMRTVPSDVFARRSDFAADAGQSLAWYFLDINHRGPAWSGAKEMFNYARSNRPTYRGLHFNFIGADSSSNRSLNPFALSPGDVVFADWEGDGTVDHVMIVWKIDYSLFVWNRYDRIRVTYQSNNTPDMGLQQVIDKNYKDTKHWATFYVFRPMDYNQAGL
jgi:Putative amidase domain